VLLKVFILVVLAMIFVQDLRSRSVYWFWFPVLLVLFIAAGILQYRSFTAIGETAFINCVFLALQFLLVSLYFSLKNRKWVNVTTGLLGWGDILLLLSVAFYLSVLNFLLFYMVSLIGALLTWLIWQAIADQKDKHIPLAGLQAIFLGAFLTVDWFRIHLNLTDDAWISNLMHK
jgi:hypothetical protein